MVCIGKKRNLTTHTYNGKIALEILECLPEFLEELDKLIFRLKGIEECHYKRPFSPAI